MPDSHDAYEPKLRVRASGLGGSGYALPTRPDQKTGKPSVVPGITTVTGALRADGISQWVADITTAACVANVDQLLNRTEEQGFRMMRFYHRRAKSEDFDNPEVDLNSYHTGVLNDLADLGTTTHDYVADLVNGRFGSELVRPEQEEMVDAFQTWWDEHDVQVVDTEISVVGSTPVGGYAGTLDHIWVIDGVPTCLDLKTSKAIREPHLMQLSAIGAAEAVLREVNQDDEGAVEYTSKKWGTTYWREEPLPAFSQYAVLHLRPSDVTAQGEYIEPFCKLEVIPSERIDAAWDIFVGALQVRHGQKRLKDAMKET